MTCAVACLTVAATTAAAPPPTPSPGSSPPFVACGATLTSDTTLTRDLVCRDGQGLTLADGVVLDLGGHRLVGPGNRTGTAVTGPYLPTVRNGTITGWGIGVSGSEPDSGGSVTEVTVRHTRLGVGSGLGGHASVTSSTFVDNVTAVGAYLSASATVTDSTFVRNGTGVESGGDFTRVTVDRSAFRDNEVAVDCPGGAITVRGSVLRSGGTALQVEPFDCVAVLLDSTVAGNETGVRQSGNWQDNGTGIVLRGNVLRDNGVAVVTGASMLLERNTFRGNGTAVTSGWTPDEMGFENPVLQLLSNDFRANGDAVRSTMPSRVGANVAVRNTGVGLHVPGATDLGGNVAYGNGTQPQCVGVVCADRPGR